MADTTHEKNGGCCCGDSANSTGCCGAPEPAASCCGESTSAPGAGASSCGASEASAKTAQSGECGGEPCMPAPSFSTFILSLASSALVNLGEVPDPSTGKREENLVLAKHTIDIVSMLQEKIQQGLDAEETRLLEGVLYELRMKYVVHRK